METKHQPVSRKRGGFTLASLKSNGSFVARVWTVGGPDLDGDYQSKGNLVNAGSTIHVSAWGHASWSTAPPVGTAIINEDSGGGIARGRFFVETDAGRHHFEIVKNATDLEWSYGFDVVDSAPHPKGGRVIVRQRVHEVSPVMKGAGLNTRTLSVDQDDDDTDTATPDDILGMGLGRIVRAECLQTELQHIRRTNAQRGN